MKKQHQFSTTGRPITANQKSPTQKSLVNSMKKVTLEAKSFNPKN